MAILMKVVTGNWVGAAAAAAAMFGTALVLSWVYVATQLDDHWDIGAIVSNGFATMFASLGVPLDFTTESAQVEGSYSSSPLLITFLAALAGVYTFSRVVRGYPTKLAALGDALRSGLVLAILTTVAMIVIRIISPKIADLAVEWDSSALGDPLHQVEGGEVLPAVAGAMFIPGIAVAVLLSATVLRSSLPSANKIVGAVASVATPAIQGLRALAWCTLPAGLVLVVARLTSPGADTNFIRSVRDIFGLPNWGIATIGTGLGAPFGLRTTDRADDVGRLSWMSDGLNWVVWLAIPAALAVVVVAAYVVTRTAPRTQPLPSAGAYLVGLLLALPLLGLIANMYLSFQYVDDGDTQKIRVGVDITEMTFTFWGASIIACFGALLVTGKLSMSGLQSRPGGVSPAQPPPPQVGGMAPPAPTQPGGMYPPPPPPPPTQPPPPPPPPSGA